MKSVSVLLLLHLLFSPSTFSNKLEDTLRVLESFKKIPGLSRIRPEGSPAFPDAPLLVNVSIKISQIRHIDPSTATLNFQFYFRQYWTDPRLSFSTPTSSSSLQFINLKGPTLINSLVWSPDLYFGNEVVRPPSSSPAPQSNFRISPEGKVIYSQRLNMELSCPSILEGKVFSCGSRVGSYGAMVDDVVVAWEHVNPLASFGVQRVAPHYNFLGASTSPCPNNSFHDTFGEELYSCLEFQLQFQDDNAGGGKNGAAGVMSWDPYPHYFILIITLLVGASSFILPQ